MTCNVFSGTLNPAQSINQSGIKEQKSQQWQTSREWIDCAINYTQRRSFLTIFEFLLVFVTISKGLYKNTPLFTVVFLEVSKKHFSLLTRHFWELLSKKLLFLLSIDDQKMCSWVQGAAVLAGRLPLKIGRKQAIAVLLILIFNVSELLGTAGLHCNITHIATHSSFPRTTVQLPDILISRVANYICFVTRRTKIKTLILFALIWLLFFNEVTRVVHCTTWHI